jgi:hypothetical protein
VVQQQRSNDPKQCSVFTIGRIMIADMQVKAAEAFTAVEAAAPNWG